MPMLIINLALNVLFIIFRRACGISRECKLVHEAYPYLVLLNILFALLFLCFSTLTRTTSAQSLIADFDMWEGREMSKVFCAL